MTASNGQSVLLDGNKILCFKAETQRECLWYLHFRAVKNIKVLLEDRDASHMENTVSFALESISGESRLQLTMQTLQFWTKKSVIRIIFKLHSNHLEHSCIHIATPCMATTRFILWTNTSHIFNQKYKNIMFWDLTWWKSRKSQSG